MDRIRNERIRGTTKEGEISKKVQESRLKWYGHVSRREEKTNTGEESDGDGGAGEKKERKTKAGVVGQHQERLVGEGVVRIDRARPA